MSHYVDPITWLDAICISEPGLEVSQSGDPSVYETIDWGSNTPLSAETLNTMKLSVYRSLIVARIKADAAKCRQNCLVAVLGTTDQEQIRTYDEKYAEAKAYLLDNASPTPMLSAEIVSTTEVLATLAQRVINEYNYAKGVLRNYYGNIEGIRRKAIADTANMTLTQLENFEPPFIAMLP